MSKVFIASSVHRWNDTRILYKQAVSLSKYYNVELHIVADFEFLDYKGVKIFGLGVWKREVDRIPLIFKLLYRIVKSDADVVHLHDPELIPVGIISKVITGKKVIYDVHENYREFISSKVWLPAFVKKPFIYVYSIFEKIACKMFDGIIGVIDCQMKYLHSNNLAIVKNYPILIARKFDCNCTKMDNTIKLVYLGDMTEDRCTKEIIEAFSVLEKKHSVTLHLIGTIPHEYYRDLLSESIEKFGIKNSVTIYGFLPLEDALNLLRYFDIGIHLLKPMGHNLPALPNKLFEYMLAELPVVMPDFANCKHIVRSSKSGLVCDPLSIDDMVEKLEYLILHPEERKRMGRNGRKAVLEKYNWYKEEENLLRIYTNILKRTA